MVSRTMVVAVCKQAREQNARLHLGARDRQRVVDRAERASLDIERRILTSRAEIVAPISASGFMIRSIGRRDSDSSPPIGVRNGWAASMPDSILMVDPELPASSIPAGSLSPRRPVPWISTIRIRLIDATPRARMHPNVDWQSAPVE